MSTRARLAETCSNGEAARAGIGTVLPAVRTSARLVFHLLRTPLYLSLAEWAIHCHVAVTEQALYTEIRTAPLGRSSLNNGHVI